MKRKKRLNRRERRRHLQPKPLLGRPADLIILDDAWKLQVDAHIGEALREAGLTLPPEPPPEPLELLPILIPAELTHAQQLHIRAIEAAHATAHLLHRLHIPSEPEKPPPGMVESTCWPGLRGIFRKPRR